MNDLNDKISNGSPRVFEFAEFSFDASKKVLWRGAETVLLAPKACEILGVLIENAPQILSREELMNQVWNDSFVEEANLTHHISSLRKALGEDGNGRKFIETIPRKGYRFVAPIKEQITEATEIVFNERTAIQFVEETSVEANDLTGDSEMAQTEKKIAPASAGNKRRSIWIFAAVVLILLLGAGSFFVYRKFYSSKISVAPTEISFKRLTPDSDATAPSVSPDGASVVFAKDENGNETLWRKQIASGELTQLLPTVSMQEARIASTRFSPDGRWIYYLKFMAKEKAVFLFRIPSAGGAEQRILADNFQSDFSISPDGKQIAYTLDWRQLIVADVESGNKRIIVERDGTKNIIKSEINSVAWSPDGSRLIFSAERIEDRTIQQLIEVDLTTGAERQIPTAEDFNVQQIEWLADDSGLIVTRQSTTSQIWRVDRHNGATSRLSDETGDFDSLRLSADSKILVAQQILGHYNIWMSTADNFDAKRQITVGAAAQQGRDGLVLMPDGKIVFTSTESGALDLWIMNADGSERKQLTFNAGKYNTGPRLTSDGRYIVFYSGRSGTSQVWRMDADGRNPVQLSKAVEIGSFSLAPDNYVYYTVFSSEQQKYQVYKVSVEGGEPIEFNEQNFRTAPQFSPDGRWYLFVSAPAKDEKSRSVLVERATGKIVRYIDTPITMYGWSHDSKAIIHTFADFNKLWRLPIDGGETRQIADFSPLKIVNWKYSPDGKKMVFSLGNTTNEIVAIENFSANETK